MPSHQRIRLAVGLGSAPRDAASWVPVTLRDWVGALVTFATVTVVLLATRRTFAHRLRSLARRTATRVDDVVAELVERTHPVTMLTAAAWITAEAWMPPNVAPAVAVKLASVVGAVQVGLWAGHLVESFAARRRRASEAAGRAADVTTWTVLSLSARAVVWIVVVILALDNVGIDVTALVAGLGIGGLAVGLALQNVLGDVFASLAIVLDRPFVVGDFLVVDDVTGTVEHIGVKTTRVRALSGEQIVISNAELLKSRIRNFQRLTERRNVMSFGVLYQTPAEVLSRIPELARDAVEAQVGTRFDRAHLCRLGESSVDFEVAYYLVDADYNRHMDVQQAVILALFQRLAELDVGFAYPTRTLHVHATGGLSPSGHTMTSK